MKVIIAGCRDYCNTKGVEWAMDSCGFEITEVVTGGCKGVDTIADSVAKIRGIDRVIMPANWVAYDHSAGPIRNWKMAAYADALIALWDGESTGTKNMIEAAKMHGLQMKIYKI